MALFIPPPTAPVAAPISAPLRAPDAIAKAIPQPPAVATVATAQRAITATPTIMLIAVLCFS
jgi:hypothetical protein